MGNLVLRLVENQTCVPRLSEHQLLFLNAQLVVDEGDPKNRSASLSGFVARKTRVQQKQEVKEAALLLPIIKPM